MAGLTSVERIIDAAAHRILDRPGRPALSRVRGALVEILVFGAKQAWAALFGGIMLAVLVGTELWYPDHAALDRNDLRTILAVLVQVCMVLGRLETLRELRVIILFHVVGTVMELFKTDVGSWIYPPGGVLHIANVPLFSGFMYAAVGSYLVRVFRLFDLRFDRYPPRWVGGVLAALIYVNFFSHHWIIDLRWLLIAAVVTLFWVTSMEFRILRVRVRMPLLAAFVGVAFVIWIAENVGTASGTWLYPSQLHGWHPVPISKMGSWFLLMMISVALVTWVYPPQPPDLPEEAAEQDAREGLSEARDAGSPAASASTAAPAAGEPAPERPAEGAAGTGAGP
ncbi:DUF817 domain-containing protein [Pseudolysinimonas kribbensis]